jgi:hypothetical protein
MSTPRERAARMRESISGGGSKGLPNLKRFD